MTITFLHLIILCLATYRLSNFLSWESGPFEIFDKLRYFVGVRYDESSRPFGKNVISKGIICQWCNSVWIGVLLVILYAVEPQLVLWLLLPFAVSAITCIIIGK